MNESTAFALVKTIQSKSFTCPTASRSGPGSSGGASRIIGTSTDSAPLVKAAATLPASGAALRGLLLARIAGIPGLEALAEDADALVRLGSGQPLLVMFICNHCKTVCIKKFS